MRNKILFILTLALTFRLQAQIPQLKWAIGFGGVNRANGYSIAVNDLKGEIYTTGSYNGTVDFDPGPAIFNLKSLGSSGFNGDIFILKNDSNGNLLWAKSIGGIDNDAGTSIKVDNAGNIYVTGVFQGKVDFNPGNGVYFLSTNLAGRYDHFILKLKSDGTFLWAKNMTTSNSNTSVSGNVSLAVDQASNVFLTGTFIKQLEFYDELDTFNIFSKGAHDCYILKLDSLGKFVWARSLGGKYADGGFAITTDNFGNIYTTGTFEQIADMDPGTNVNNLTSVGSIDIFITKLDSSGNFKWAKGFGGNLADNGNSLVTDLSGNLYLVGNFQEEVDFDPGLGIYSLTAIGQNDIFILKLDINGNFLWAKMAGGDRVDHGYGITIDKHKNLFITGGFMGKVDFDPNSDTSYLISKGGFGQDYDVFNLKLDSLGKFKWVVQFGGEGYDEGKSIFVDMRENIFTTGYFSSNNCDFDPGIDTFSISKNGSEDIFIVKIGTRLTGNIRNELIQDFDVYPNPTNGIFSITCGVNMFSKIIIYDVLGKKVYETQFHNFSYDLTFLHKGIYTIELISNNSVSYKKLQII